jgi:PAS domain S-box-containing protein
LIKLHEAALALSQAMLRAPTSEEIYRAVGREVTALGYQVVILDLGDSLSHLIISHMTFEAAVLQAVAGLTGSLVQDYRIPVVPGGFLERSLDGETVFSEQAAALITEILPESMQPLAGHIAVALGFEQAIFAPMTIENEIRGLLFVTGRGLAETDTPAVTSFASQVGIALENLQLRQKAGVRALELERHIAELASLNAMAAVVNESLHLDELLERAIDEALRLAGVDMAGIVLIDSAAGDLVVHARRGMSDELVEAAGRVALGDAPAGQTAQIGAPIVLEGPADYGERLKELLERQGVQSACSVPLQSPSGVIGAMSLCATSPGFFDPARLGLLSSLGQQISFGVERARLHESVQASAKTYKAIFEQVSASIVLFDPTNGTLVGFNAQAHESLGYSREEFEKFTIADFGPAISPATDLPQQIAAVVERGTGTFETRLSRKGGEFADVLISTGIISVGSKEMIQCAWRDITARKQTEEKSREYRERLERLVSERTREKQEVINQLQREVVERVRVEEAIRLQAVALESAANAIVITNRAGHIIWVNAAFTALTGYTAEEAIGQSPRLLQSGVHDPAFYEQLWQTILSGQVWHSEITNRRKDKTLYYEEMTITPVQTDSGEITHFIAIKQDITERKNWEMALRQRNRELTLLNHVISTAGTRMHPEAVLEVTCRELALALELPQAGAAILDESRTSLTVIAEYLARGGVSALGATIPLDDNPATQYVLEYKKSLAVFDAQHDPRMTPVHELMRQRGVASILLLPLLVQDRVVGTLGLDTSKPREFSEDEIALATIVAAAASQILERAHLYQEATETKEALSRALEETARSQRFLLALSQAAQAVQRAQTAEEIYQTVGDELAKLGYHASALTLTDDREHLMVSHTTFLPFLLAMTGQLSDQSILEYRLPLTPGGYFAKAINEGSTTFFERTTDLIASTLPERVHSLANQVAVAHGLEHIIPAPLMVNGETHGLLVITGSGLDEADTTAVMVLANQTAIALENSQLLKKLQRSNLELNRLHRASGTLFTGAISGTRSLARNIVETILKEFEHTSCSLFLVENETSVLRRVAVAGPYAPELHDRHLAIEGKGLAAEAARTGRMLNVPDVSSRADDDQGWPAARSELTVPLKIGDRVIGVLDLQNSEPAGFDGDDEHLMAAFAGRAALAIQNARLYSERRRRAEELESMVKISSALRTAETKMEMVPFILDEVMALFGAEGAVLALRDPETGGMQIELARGAWAGVTGLLLPGERGVVEKAFSIGLSQIKDLTDHSLAVSFDSSDSPFVAACAPMIAQGQSIGELWIGREEGISGREIQLLTGICDIAANAIQRAALFDQTVQHAAELEKRVAERTAELRIANAEMARAVRTKDEFLANMSHELRTPLNNVLVRVEMLLQGIQGGLAEKQVRSLNIIEDSSRHLLDLINDILDVSKIEANQLKLDIQRVAIESVCQASLHLVRQMAHSKEIKIATKIEPASLMADGRRLKQILVNLLTNAIKFTPEGGQVGLEVNLDESRELLHFVVWDTGIGMAAEDLPRLFKPFTQLDGGLTREYEGTGLGLALVSRLTEMHQGGIAVESDLGQGSRFTVSLPWRALDRKEGKQRQVPAMPNRRTKAVEPATALPARADTILVAEDNEVLIEALQEFLAAVGHQTLIARNGREAIKQARDNHPHLILMDIQMPDIDGLEAIRQIRADRELQRTPIIALTGLAMAGDRERCLEAGASYYLSKPFDIPELMQVIEVQLNGSPTNGGVANEL